MIDKPKDCRSRYMQGPSQPDNADQRQIPQADFNLGNIGPVERGLFR